MKTKLRGCILGLGLLGVVLLPLPWAIAAQNPFPGEVKATGELVIDRSDHAECMYAVPKVLRADIEVIINTVTQTVSGTIGNGEGSGTEDILVCGDDSAKRHIATLEFTGAIGGVFNPDTGRIESSGEEGNVNLTVSGSGEYGYYPDMPEWTIVQNGGGFICGLTDSNATVSSCPLIEITNILFPANLTGTLTPQGELNLELNWTAPYCEKITRDPDNPSVRSSDWLSDECPHTGTIAWTNIVLTNQRPVIDSLTIDPAEPVTTDVVTFTVSASDPDGDELTYQWTVDGDHQQTINAPTSTWTNPARGSHTIEVRVIDPGGGYDEVAIDFWVEDPDMASTAGGDDSTTTSAATSTTTTAPKTAGETSGNDKEEAPSQNRKAGGSAVLAAAIALAGDALRRGKIRGKAGELYRWGKRKADRGQEIAEKVERKAKKVGRYATDPTGAAFEDFRKSDRGQRAERRFREAERKAKKVGRYATDPTGAALDDFRKSDRGQRVERRLKKADAIATNPLKAALERVRESRRGRRLERRGTKIAGIAADPYGTVDRAARKKMKEYVSRLKTRARRRALDSGLHRRYQKLADRLSKRTKGILDPKSALRLLRSMGNSRRFGREIQRNPALARHVIRRAGLSPLAVEALGGPRSIGRMLGRLSRNPGRELRRVGRFLGRPKGWVPEMGRGIRRIGRALGL